MSVMSNLLSRASEAAGAVVGVELAPGFSGEPKGLSHSALDTASIIDQDEVLEELAEELLESERLANVLAAPSAAGNESWGGW
ncbi:hypothetical protein [Chromobacterium phragmitis]|uniref:Uncharacterized protein n=1 Tax=Chromobacterium phragmitis TaxID=2202141 RepID=A0ABV0J0L3_9NEIS